MMSEKTIPPPAPLWLYHAVGNSQLATDLLAVRNFIEAVMLDDESFEAGLWQGDMPKRAMAAVDRVIELFRPLLAGDPAGFTPPAGDCVLDAVTVTVSADSAPPFEMDWFPATVREDSAGSADRPHSPGVPSSDLMERVMYWFKTGGPEEDCLDGEEPPDPE